ncbi:MAG TPA: glucose-1-phosphate adenylyltransferase [Candidatus Omnitrophica bacterium]|nr:glucose-1-phosphate adenylyltransferase [Candidatus Omnitrophota bacterium]
MMNDLLCLILGGGRGTRLFPLTKYRCKPAVPLAGKYRLVDIPISNCLNSGINQIYVLTQFLSESLNKHVNRTYKLEAFSKGFVEIMAAEQSMDTTDWFQGTADAVRRCLKHFNNPSTKYVLVLSGDQLYKMDFSLLLNFHIEKKSEITIASSPVKPEDVSAYGILNVDKQNRISSFVEKPKDKEALKAMAVKIDSKKYYLASMGIYLFNKDTLVEILTNNKKADFGREIIPHSFPQKLTYAYIHQGCWRDIGTIKAFYQENLMLTMDLPPLDLFDETWQFFTRPRYLPPAKIKDSVITSSLIGEGSIVDNCSISHSVIGLRSRIDANSTVEDTVMMGADFYQTMDQLKTDESSNMPNIGIGKDCVIKKAILDKNVRIGNGAKIINKKKLGSFEADRYIIDSGIVIIPKNTIIPPGAVI